MSTSLLEQNPELAKEWHQTKNKGLTAADISKGSNQKVWWECAKGHSYEASVNNRSRGSGCPFCSGRKAAHENTLSVYSPAIANEWHPTKNAPLLPTQIGYGSSKKVWWVCINNQEHIWEAVISSRTKANKPTGCPYCKGSMLIADKNSLKAKNPSIADEWHTSKNGDTTPAQVRYASKDKAWWLCPEGHEYYAVIGNRTKRINPSGCPYCASKLATDTNSLAALGGQRLLEEWDKEKNGELNLSSILAGSHTKAWWRCSKDHSWEAQVKSRVQGAGCPYCSNQSSIPEVRILSELEFIYKDIASRHKQGKIEVDIFIPSLRIGIEFDGSYFHRNKEDKDREKTKRLNALGIHLVRARELPLSKLSDEDIEVSQKGITKKDINNLARSILKTGGATISDSINQKTEEYLSSEHFLNDDLFRKYVECFPDPLPNNSLQSTHPEVAKEWHSSKNSPLTPKNFTPGSNAKAWWVCPFGHEYETKIISRTSRHGCPICSGNLIALSNALITTHPQLSKEWHPTKNRDLSPSNSSKGSTRKVWWQCGVCNHSWEAVIYNRSKENNPSGCPRCWSARRKGLPRRREAQQESR